MELRYFKSHACDDAEWLGAIDLRQVYTFEMNDKGNETIVGINITVPNEIKMNLEVQIKIEIK